MGLERLLLLLQTPKAVPAQVNNQVSLCILSSEGSARIQALQLAQHLRQHRPELSMLTYTGEAGFKAQFKLADKSGAAIALVMGEQEALNQQVGVKFLRNGQHSPLCVAQQQVADRLDQWLIDNTGALAT